MRKGVFDLCEKQTPRSDCTTIKFATSSYCPFTNSSVKQAKKGQRPGYITRIRALDIRMYTDMSSHIHILQMTQFIDSDG